MGPEIEIRPAGIDDLEPLLELCQRYCAADGHHFDPARIRSALGGLLDRPDRGLVLLAFDPAVDRSTAVGYAVVTWGYSIESGGVEALLDEIYLDQRGDGIGTQLLDRVLAEARAVGAHRLFCETEAANHGARRFYLRHHFEHESSIWLSRDL